MENTLNNYEIYLGTVAGSLIHFSTDKKHEKNVHLRNNEKQEITALCWGRTNQEILIGYKKGTAQIYNTITGDTTKISQLEKSPVTGILPFDKHVIVAMNSGNIYQCNNNSMEPLLKNDDQDKTVEKIVLNPYNQNVFGLGGINNDIKLYDMTAKKLVFQGKSDRHDKLNLAQPVSINSITFFNERSGMDIGTVTRQGQIRIYDTRAQRRAIKIFNNNESVYTTICATNVDKEVIVGSNKGYLQLMDLRSHIQPIKTFKGFMGGLTDVVCDPDAPIVISSALDRVFRMHNLQEKKQEYEEYMKIQTTLLLMRRKHYVTPAVVEYDEEVEELEEVTEDVEDNEVEVDSKKNRKKQKASKSKKLKT